MPASTSRRSASRARPEYVAAYARRTGRKDIADWDFYLAFSLFRLAAIVQGVYKRGLDGNASSETATKYGNRAKALADMAWSMVEKRASGARPPGPLMLGPHPGALSERAERAVRKMSMSGPEVRAPYSSVTGTIEASLPLGQFSLSTTALAGLRKRSML